MVCQKVYKSREFVWGVLAGGYNFEQGGQVCLLEKVTFEQKPRKMRMSLKGIGQPGWGWR